MLFLRATILQCLKIAIQAPTLRSWLEMLTEVGVSGSSAVPLRPWILSPAGSVRWGALFLQVKFLFDYLIVLSFICLISACSEEIVCYPLPANTRAGGRVQTRRTASIIQQNVLLSLPARVLPRYRRAKYAPTHIHQQLFELVHLFLLRVHHRMGFLWPTCPHPTPCLCSSVHPTYPVKYH